MYRQRTLLRGFIAILLSLVVVTNVFAGVSTANGLALEAPNYPLSGPGLQSCEPWDEPSANSVTLSGIPAGATVTATFAYAAPFQGSPMYQPPVTFSNVEGGTLEIPVVYPLDTTTWPGYNEATNERTIAVAVFIHVRHNGTTYKINSKQWWVRCAPPLPPAQGCTPGYWRQDHHFDSWEVYSPDDRFRDIFEVEPSFPDDYLEDVLWLGGGPPPTNNQENALARHAVAALLNAAHSSINYVYTVEEVIAGVQNAYASGNFEAFKDDLDFANNAGCPLD